MPFAVVGSGDDEVVGGLDEDGGSAGRCCGSDHSQGVEVPVVDVPGYPVPVPESVGDGLMKRARIEDAALEPVEEPGEFRNVPPVHVSPFDGSPQVQQLLDGVFGRFVGPPVEAMSRTICTPFHDLAHHHAASGKAVVPKDRSARPEHCRHVARASVAIQAGTDGEARTSESGTWMVHRAPAAHPTLPIFPTSSRRSHKGSTSPPSLRLQPTSPRPS